MISILTTAKPFVGDTGRRQSNALRSWRWVFPDAEIVLFGGGEGYEAAAAAVGGVRVPDIACSTKGTPRIDAMFAWADTRARHGLRMYVNADILFDGGLRASLGRIDFARFLAIGQRTELQVDEAIGEGDAGARVGEIAARAAREGRLETSWAIDYFLYRGDVWTGLPALTVGRAGYDNFLVLHALRGGVPVVDLTHAVRAVHQSHDYGHVAGGRGETYFGEEAQANRAAAGDPRGLLTIADADWTLYPEGLTRSWCRWDARRAVEVEAMAAGATYGAARAGWRHAAIEAQIRWQRRKVTGWFPLLKYPAWLLRERLPAKDVTSQRLPGGAGRYSDLP